MLKELLDLLNKDRSPFGNTQLPVILDPQLQRHLSHFSAITHGFGSPAIVAGLTATLSYLNESIVLLDKRAGGGPGPLPVDGPLRPLNHATREKDTGQ